MKILPFSSRKLARLNKNYNRDLNFIDLRKSIKIRAVIDLYSNNAAKQRALQNVELWTESQKAMAYDKYFTKHHSFVDNVLTFFKNIFK